MTREEQNVFLNKAYAEVYIIIFSKSYLSIEFRLPNNYNYSIMDEPKAVIVKYTADKMKAVVALSKNAGQITLGLILKELIHKGIVHGLNTDVMNKLVANPVYDKYIEVANGTPAVSGVDGKAEFLAGDGLVLDGGFKANHEFVVVNAGDPMARRSPPKPGTDGINIFGEVIPAEPVKDVELKGGSGVKVSPDDPDLLVADASGALVVAPDGVIEVRSHTEIAGDVDAGSGDVTFPGYVTVSGTVRSGFAVSAKGSIVVKGEVENARIECDGDLFLHSTVRGGNRAAIVCGGSVYAPRMENVKISADGGVIVEGDIVNAEASCKGEVKAASIIGGNVSAVCGITVKQAGDEAGVPTVLDVGGIHEYIKERTSIKGSVETQNLLTEGYVSELYSYVRDNMDESGLIADENMEQYAAYVKNLTESISIIRDYEGSLREIEALLEKAKECRVIAGVLYPNVLVKLGFSDQPVKDALYNVNLKPTGV